MSGSSAPANTGTQHSTCAPKKTLDQATSAIARGVVAFVGEEFFRQLVRNLATTLGVRYAFVAEFLPDVRKVRTLAHWGGQGYLDNVVFDLAGTPCEKVLTGEFLHCSKGVHALFPTDPALAKLGIESYLGVPLLDPKRRVLGHLAILHTDPFGIDASVVSVLESFSARASVELERQRIEKRLRESEEWLATVLASAMDAIVTIDDKYRITLFNPAAEKMFQRKQDTIIGQPLDALLAGNGCAIVEKHLHASEQSGEKPAQLWAPEGLMAQRADGERFPIDATISPMVVGGQRFCTLILRDVNERKKARAALEKLKVENVYLQEELRTANNAEGIVGESQALRRVLGHVEQVAPTDATVLISGETGTGKELIALAVHGASARRDKLLVKLNCAALPRELVESELFGHEQGSFTGATRQRKGRFELAHEGTLFLDEVGELSLESQAKLLRVLQTQEFERIGGTRSIHVDVRMIAATNRDLAKLVAQGEFRSDLYYRLHVFPIEVPPLRERPTDIPNLVELFVTRYSRSMGKAPMRVSQKLMKQLQAYDWPGNIRELQNVIERAVVLSPTDTLEVDESQHLKPHGEAVPAAGTLEEVERSYIESVLKRTEGKVGGPRGAAVILGLNANTLRSRMQKLGIKKSG